jgi:uncharacterized protein with PQ loop repeat
MEYKKKKIDKESFADFFGWVAAIMTIYFFIAPIVPFYKVIKGKLNYEDTPGAYITLVYLNCLCWYVYGDYIYSDQMKLCYLVGIITSFILLAIYLLFEQRKYTHDAILNAVIIINASLVIYKGLNIVVDDVDNIARICLAISLPILFYPIHIIYQVIKRRNYNLIPYKTSWYSMGVSLCWIIYSVLFDEFYIILPNVFIYILSSIQVFLYYRFKKIYAINDDNTISIISFEKSNEEIEKEEKDEKEEKKDKRDNKEKKEKKNSANKKKNEQEESQPALEEKPVQII